MVGRIAVAAASAAMAGSCLVACSSTPAVCTDLDAVKTTTHQLKNMELGKNTLSDLQKNLQKLDNQVRKLASAASSQYANQIGAVKSSLHSVESAASSAASNPSASTIGQLQSAVHGFASSVSKLTNAVSSTC